MHVSRTTSRGGPWVRLRDAALVAVCLVTAWLGTAAAATTPGPRGVAYAAMLPGILALTTRRTHPVGSVVVWLVPNLAYWLVWGAPENFGVLLPAGVLLYAVGRWEPDRRRAIVTLVAVLPAMVVHEWRDPTNTDLLAVLRALPYDAVAPAAWLLGAFVRLRHEQQASTAAAIAAGERTRIAREMHDIVAHGLGVMVVQAEGAAEIVGQDPDRARAAMERVAETGRESLIELRRALGLLRGSGPASHEPLPGLGRLDPLLLRARDSGLVVSHETTGSPRPLSPGVDLALYRVVQEALTNTVRHARAARAVVRVDHAADHVRVSVTDDGSGSLSPAGAAGSGLLGIRERMRVLGGEVEAGPLPAGGFRVSVRVPRGEDR